MSCPWFLCFLSVAVCDLTVVSLFFLCLVLLFAFHGFFVFYPWFLCLLSVFLLCPWLVACWPWFLRFLSMIVLGSSCPWFLYCLPVVSCFFVRVFCLSSVVSLFLFVVSYELSVVSLSAVRGIFVFCLWLLVLCLCFFVFCPWFLCLLSIVSCELSAVSLFSFSGVCVFFVRGFFVFCPRLVVCRP